MTGEITEEQDWRSHDLDHLLSRLKANLTKLDEIPEGCPSEATCDLIEDMAKFGMLGESLRYPIGTINEKTRKKAFGDIRLCGLIPDIAALIDAAEKAWLDFGGLISYLMECEEMVIDAKLQQF